MLVSAFNSKMIKRGTEQWSLLCRREGLDAEGGGEWQAKYKK